MKHNECKLSDMECRLAGLIYAQKDIFRVVIPQSLAETKLRAAVAIYLNFSKALLINFT